MRSALFEVLINISLGIAWVVILGGAFLVFSHFFYTFGFFFAMVAALFGAVPGILMVLGLEFMLSFSEMKENSIKQTKILEKIYKELSEKEDDKKETNG